MPFISTTHYSLLAALKHWGIKPGQVQIINLQPPAIIAAWQRGDIDGAYVWAPAVNELEKDGTVLTDSEKGGPVGGRRRSTCGWCAKTLPRSILRW